MSAVQAAHMPLELAERIPTSSSTTERDLFAGYRAGPAPITRRLRCACTGWLEAVDDDSESVLSAVRVHNQSTTHQQWRARRQEEARSW